MSLIVQTPSGNFHLTGAQLIPEQDLFYKVQKPAALFYENTIPIWQDVANGNWKLASEFLSKLAAEKHQGFAYYSGVIDILELADGQGNGKRIFLAHGQDGKNNNRSRGHCLENRYSFHR